MRAEHIKIEQMISPMGISGCRPRITRTPAEGVSQTAYEITAITDHGKYLESGKVVSSDMHHVFPVLFDSREHVELGIRLYDENGAAGNPECASFEMGFLSAEEFIGKWILPEEEMLPEKGKKKEKGPGEHQPAARLRKQFMVERVGKGRLYITARGLYIAYLNGKRVGDAVLTPGSTDYNDRFPAQVYDVTGLLKVGENLIEVDLGDGWYRSVSGVDGVRNVFGREIGLLCQLECDEKAVVISDESWEASQEGPIRFNDMQQGEIFDARMEAFKRYHPVRVAAEPAAAAVFMNTVPVREQEVFSGRIFTTPNGETVMDFGQNMAGYTAFTIEAQGGETIRILHGETLDENGNFTQENFQDRKRHQEGGTRQEILYTCKPGVNDYKPSFTIFGFRYAKIETNADLSKAEFRAIAVYSDMKETVSFTSACKGLEKLVENAKWSQKSNFCDVPTDCPTRERAAWTGDMGVFCETGLMLMEAYPVIRKWLADCRSAQYPDGRVANIAPKVKQSSFFGGLLSGSVGWGDAIIKVPYTMYRMFGDESILRENYDMMKKWYGFLKKRAAKRPLFKKSPVPGKLRKYLIEKGIDYGEWCEPDVSSVGQMGKTNVALATAWFYRSAKCFSEIAGILGNQEDHREAENTAVMVRQAFRACAVKDGKIDSERQADHVRAIMFGLLDDEEINENAELLDRLVERNGYHLNTGFLSTPLLLYALSESGHADTAFRLLLQDTAPSWLYEVKKGATTMWETWNGIDENNVPHASLNHYSYGAVCEWIIHEMAGIRVDGRRITVSPLVSEEVGNMHLSYDAPCGHIVSGWSMENGETVYQVEIPSNTEAEFVYPDGRIVKLTPGVYEL